MGVILLSKTLINTAITLLKGLADLVGGIVPLPEWAETALGYLFNAISAGSGLLKWVIPNETIYNSLISIALIYIGVWLASKIIGFAIRLYDLILV